MVTSPMAVLKDKVFPCCFDKGDQQKNPSSRILKLTFLQVPWRKKKGRGAPLLKMGRRLLLSTLHPLIDTKEASAGGGSARCVLTMGSGVELHSCRASIKFKK